MRNTYNYYFGKDENGNYPATKAGSCLIVGLKGAGKTNVVNSIIANTVKEKSAFDVKMHYVDCSSVNHRSIANLRIPHFAGVIGYDVQHIKELLMSMRTEVMRRLDVCGRNGYRSYMEEATCGSHYEVLIMEDFLYYATTSGDTSFVDTIQYILDASEKTGVYLILTSYPLPTGWEWLTEKMPVLANTVYGNERFYSDTFVARYGNSIGLSTPLYDEHALKCYVECYTQRK